MADASLTTPGAVSRRFLFSVATAVPIAAATAGVSPGSAPSGLQPLLDRYRDIGIRLREVEATYARTLQLIPATFRPGFPPGHNIVSRWAEWTRTELDALGLPPSMTLRPSETDFIRYFQQSVSPNPEKREEAKRRHRIRVTAWHDRRNLQKEWFSRTGLDLMSRERTRLLADRNRTERELMALMIGPDKAATDA
jgi:hypothetical protein